jgi:5-formyltetrahydrofolate cyclo-ligase
VRCSDQHLGVHRDPTPDARDLRTHYRELRRAVGPREGIEAARAVEERIAALVSRRAPGRVATYLPTDGEIDPTLAVDRLRAAGWQIHLPVIGPERTMAFAEWRADASLVPNRHGIEEPADAEVVRGARDLDLLLVPCVAVDPAGNRLGFGAGYYDRALATGEDPAMVSSRPRPLLVGVVHDVQIAPALPREPWDVPLDVVVCGSGTVFTGVRTLPMGW